MRAYRHAQAAAEAMPPAVNHGEFYFQQVGWAARGTSGQLVVFDLETLALRPRFTDIATVLYPLSIYTSQPQAALLEVYLARWRELTGQTVGPNEALAELRTLRVTELCNSLPWLVEAAQPPGAGEMRHTLALAAACLRDDLLELSSM